MLTTFCNLECVWCHREEEHVKKSGYLSKNMDYEKLKKLLPQLKGFDVLSWGGLGEPMLYKNFYEALNHDLTDFFNQRFDTVH